jgi:N-acetylglucosamine-6-phosphate deacetylase
MEAPFLHPKLGAHSGKFDIEPGPQAIETLLAHGKGCIRIMTIAPELPGAIECITALRARSVIPSIGHSLAEPSLLDRAIDRGASLATHLLNGTFPLSAREPGVVPVGLNEYLLVRDDVWAEFISDTDGAHIHPVVMKILLRCKGLDRLILVTDSMFTAGMPSGTYLLPDGRTIRSDGSVNRLPDGHLTGSAMRMNRALESLVRHTGLPLLDALRTATVNPARLLGLETVTGSIQAGLRADLAVIDDSLDVRMTVVGGSIAYDRLSAR